MRIEINGQLVHETSQIDDIALDWRLIDKKQWVKNAIIGQVHHARKEMIKEERSRVMGKEVGMPASMKEDDLITWFTEQPLYMTALQKEEAKEIPQ